MTNSMALSIFTVVAVALVAPWITVAAAAGCARGTGYYDTTGCALLDTCATSYCSCLGLATAVVNTTNYTTCVAPAGKQAFAQRALTCSLFTPCVRAFTTCQDNMMENNAAAFFVLGATCPILEFHTQHILIASGQSYSQSILATECQRTACRLADEAGALVPGLVNFTCPDVCRSPITTNFTLRIGGNGWATILANSSWYTTIISAAISDTTGVLGVATNVTQLTAGSLVVAGAAFDGPTAQLTASIQAAARNSSWLKSLTAVYVANGYSASDVTVLSLFAGDEPTTAAPYIAPVDALECNAGCITGIVAVSLVVLVGLIATIAYCISIHRAFHVPVNARSLAHVHRTIEAQCDWLGIDARRVTAALSEIGLILQRRPQDAPPLKPYHAVLTACEAVCFAARDDDPTDVTIAQYYLRRHEIETATLSDTKVPKADRVMQRVIDAAWAWFPKKHRPLTKSEAEDRLEKLFARRYKQLYSGFKTNELPRVLESLKGVTLTPQSELTTDQTSVLTLLYGLFQHDAPERKERSLYLGFSFEEAAAFRKYFHDDAVLHDADYIVTRKRFIRAYTFVKGGAPDWEVTLRIFPHADYVLTPEEVLNNATTSDARSRERSFLYFYAKDRLERAFQTELAIKFLPFLVLFIVYMVTGYGLDEAYWFTRANAQFLTEERFPPLPDDFPASCTPNCAFWSSLYQGMMADIALNADVLNWLNGPVIERFWPKPNATGEAPLVPGVGAVGVLRVRQVRVAPAPSDSQYSTYFDSTLYTPEQRTVVPQWFNQSEGGIATAYRAFDGTQSQTPYGLALNPNASLPLRNAFSYRSESALNATGLNYRGRQSLFPSAGFALDIPLYYTREQAAAMMSAALNAKWIDLETRFVIVEFFAYARNLQAVGRQRFAVEMTAGGIMIPSWDTYVFPLFDVDLYPNVYFGFIALYLLVLTAITIPSALYHFFWRIPRGHVRAQGTYGFKAHWRAIWWHSLANGWATLAVLNAMLLIPTWILRFYWMWFGVSKVGIELVQTDHYPAYLDDIAYAYQAMGYVHAANIGVVALMVLHYLSRYEALGLVTNTIRRASSELLSLLLVFGILLVAFSLAANIAFGTNLLSYATLPRSIGSMLYAVANGPNYAEWKSAKINYAPVLFTFFTILMILLLLNMVVTVLMDAFNSVVQDKYDSGPLDVIMENDNHTQLAPASMWQNIRHSIVFNFLVKMVRYTRIQGRRVIQKIQRCCGCEFVSHDFDYEAEMLEFNRGDQYRFWKGVSFAVELIQARSVFDAAIGHQHLADLTLPLMSRVYDAITPAPFLNTDGSDGDSSSGDDEANDPRAREPADVAPAHREQPPPHFTVFEKLYQEYKGSTRKVLRLFQELPNYHLMTPSTILIQNLMEIRHRWRALIDDYTTGDDDNDDMTALDATNSAVAVRDALTEIALQIASGKANLTHLPRKQFAFGGFYPLITRKQAAKVRESFDNIVAQRMCDTPGPIPYAVTIGEMADVMKEQYVGRYHSDDPEGSHETCMQPVEFRCISEPVVMSDGNTYEFIGRLSVEALLERGIREADRRKEFDLALGWTAENVAQFIRGASAYCAADVNDGRPKQFSLNALISGDDFIPSEVFCAGWKAATGHSYADSITMRWALSETTYSQLFNFVTKTPGEHSQHCFLEHFALRMTAISGETYNLLWYVVFLVLFTIYAISGRGLGEGANMQISVQELMATQQYLWPQVNKTDDQFIYITNLDDWSGFLTQIIIPTLFANPTDTTGMYPLPKLPMTALGAIRIRQQRSAVYDCSAKLGAVTRSPERYGYKGDSAAWYEQRIATAFKPDCVDDFKPGSGVQGSFGGADAIKNLNISAFNNPAVAVAVAKAYYYQGCTSLRSNGLAINDYAQYGCGGYALTLPLNVTLADATAAFQYLMNNNWIDANTGSVVVDAVYYHYGLNLVQRWRYVTPMGHSGSFDPFYDVITFKPFVPSNYSSVYLGFMGVFLFMLLIQIVLYCWSVSSDFKAIRSRGQTRLNSFIMMIMTHPWHLVNFIGFGMFISSWVIRAILMNRGIGSMRVWDANRSVDDVEYEAQLYDVLNIMDSFIALITYGRLLSFFHLIPRLNLLGRTISLAFMNIGSLAFVFMVTFGAFGIVAYTVYGSTYSGFATMTRSFESLFRVLVDDEGGVDYHELSSIHPIYAGVFYTLFLIACQFVLFNIIVALLNEAFGNARAEQFNFRAFNETMAHDAHAKRNLQGATNFALLDVFLNEVALGLWILLWLLTYPFYNHLKRQQIKHHFYRNPRYFWAKVTECFRSANPAHAWYMFVDEICDAKDLLGVVSQISVASNSRITREESAMSPSARQSRARPSASPDRNRGGTHAASEHGSPNAWHAADQTSGSPTSMSFARQVFDVSSFAAEFSVGAVHAHPAALVEEGGDVDDLSQLVIKLGPTIARCDVQQSYHQGDVTRHWRVKRVQEVLADALADELDDAWAMLCIASRVTKQHRRSITESMLQEMHLYRKHSAVYDGRTVQKLANVHKQIEAVTVLMLDATTDEHRPEPEITSTMHRILAQATSVDDRSAPVEDALDRIRRRMMVENEVHHAAPISAVADVLLGVGRHVVSAANAETPAVVDQPATVAAEPERTSNAPAATTDAAPAGPTAAAPAAAPAVTTDAAPAAAPASELAATSTTSATDPAVSSAAS